MWWDEIDTDEEKVKKNILPEKKKIKKTYWADI